MKDFKIFLLKEWKESDSYIFEKWFDDLRKKFESFFKTQEELEFDYLEYDSSTVSEIQVGFLYFHEKEISYRAEIIINSDTLSPEDEEIESVDFILYGNNLKTGEEIGNLKTEVKKEEITEDLLVRLIDKFKEENNL